MEKKSGFIFDLRVLFFWFIFIYNYIYIIMNKEKKKSGRPKTVFEKNVTWPILMRQSFKDEYKMFCDKNAISMNRRVKLLMQKDMEDNLIIK